jgi:hypothetical protein
MRDRVKAALAATWQSIKSVSALLVTAVFWYLLLASAGVAAASTGVAVQFGNGYGLITFGALCICGSEMVRTGMRRA